MNKRIFIISVVFFLVAIAIAGIYFWRNPSQLPGATPTDTTTPFGIPAGNREPGTNPDETGTANTSSNMLNVKVLTKLSEEPVAGASFGAGQVVHYTERASGHILGVDLATGEISRISNTTIPKIYESVWSPKGNTTVMRSLDNSGVIITSYLATFTVSTSTSASTTKQYKMSGVTLPTNIEQIAFSPSGKNIFYLQSSGFGSKGYKGGLPHNANPVEIFSSPISEWSVAWPEESTLTFNTKPSAGVAGTLFKLNLKNNSFSRVLGNINGLVAKMSPDATNVAYTDNTGSLSIYNIKTGTTTNTNLKTIADKCVWSKKYPYLLYCAVPETLTDTQIPNSWYLGSASYTDTIYLVNIRTGNNDMLGALKKDYNALIDITDLALSENEFNMTFINKKDLTLWSFKIQSEGELY